MTKARLLQGNQACAEGAIAAGVSFFAGYPITPSTEIAEILAKELPLRGGKFIQMEDEIASMGAVCGAAMTGVKAITATSGPGFSLKQELIGYASMAEIPVVVVNVQRAGPSTGLPTSPAQGDVMQARWGTHGDRAVIVLSPGSVLESFHVTVQAFNFAEKYRTPVILLLDEVIGHMRERVELPEAGELTLIDRKKPVVPPEDYQAYKPDSDQIPPMAAFGEGYFHHVTGLTHTYQGLPTQDAKVADELVRRLNTKIDDAAAEITLYTEHFVEGAEIVVVAYGGTARAAISAVKKAREQGIKVGLLKLITLWPFPGQLMQAIAKQAHTIIVPEMNYGQLVGEVQRYAGLDKVVPVNRVDGAFFDPDEILAPIVAAQGGGK
ncbi:2-oxoacid:acceptor oxidoreductase subunit alpha|uniref:2-oxoglutarate ferredoxin oxidoreductase subunit alpha n=1 Tax=Dendrosporobacter quercicolus TaxID=146817 RepID=A0A1G9LH58_9FIRM|nr:2-oxoacid:acceptor oxidoreductase subunit alpha [Dendrosporobacter quercicolus]NSL46709.1 2-oxoacid:acceptor oxidoreductase subunit alpha [Dendrosporobacter quercicolus DSM 1736]SDL61198.1 2-oxoglutarate ferredoxin oxidoreductase subunit alpha [Dendrosporobacter quercicolus]